MPKKPQKFSTALLKFIAALLVCVSAGWGLLYLGSTQFDGVLKWVLMIAGGALLLGVMLYGSALSGEVRRDLGVLPLGKPGKDLKSMPLYQGRGALGDTKPTSTT